MPSHGDEVSSRHDVVVIGAGPAGELGGSLGYSVALVERDIVGGTVVTSGDAPTKTFREAADARELCACRPAPTGSEQAAEP